MDEQSTGKKIQGVVAAVVGTVANAVQGKLVVAREEVAKSRMVICEACEFFLPARKKCGYCGCSMPFKTRLAVGGCPKGKW